MFATLTVNMINQSCACFVGAATFTNPSGLWLFIRATAFRCCAGTFSQANRNKMQTS